MSTPMKLEDFRRCKTQDFYNGATIDEIDAALGDREKILETVQALHRQLSKVNIETLHVQMCRFYLRSVRNALEGLVDG